MNENKKLDPPWVNSNLINENTSKYPFDELIKFAGKQIAWNLDGTKILASGEDYPQLFQALDELGIDQTQVVLDYVPTKDEETLI